MTGGPELRPAAAEGAAAGRPQGGKLARAGATPSTPFDALLAGLAPKGDRDPASAGDARRLGRIAEALGANSGRFAGPVLDGAEAEAEIVAIHAGSPEQSLAQGVAERIAAALAGGPAKGGGDAVVTATATEARPGSAEGRREGALAASIAASASLGRKADASGAAASRGAPPVVSVIHRETIFAVPSLPGARAQAVGRGDRAGAPGDLGAPMAALPSAHESRVASEPGAVRQGRAEQLILGDRAVSGRGAAAPAKAPEAAASALVRAVAEEARTNAGPAGGDAAGKALYDGAFVLPGAADQRASVSASPAATAAAQPATAPSTPSAPPGAAKVLHIQLHPAELGVLEVRMRMGEAGLEVHIEAGRPETAALLRSDRDTLESVLRGAGHTLDAVTVSVSEKSGDASGQPPKDAWQGPAFGARAEAQAGSPREQGGRFDDRSPSRPDGRATEQVIDDEYQSAAAVRPGGGLYL